MRYAALLDLETTGLDSSVDRIIEIAVCVYDLELACPIESYASLVRLEDGRVNDAEKHNRIPTAALEFAQHPIVVWRRVAELVVQADVVAAHRAEFDRGFCAAQGQLTTMTWVCTKTDFDWPGVGRGDHLVHLALAYGLGVSSAHRALTDVDHMARILTRVHELGHSLPDLFRKAARPKKRFVALVSYDQRQIAKDAGFLWNEKSREWYRMMPPEDVEALSFRVVQRD